MLYGWSYEQWALALSGKDPKNLSEARKIKREYMARHRMNPIEKGIIITASGEDERPRNYQCAMFIEMLAIKVMGGHIK